MKRIRFESGRNKYPAKLLGVDFGDNNYVEKNDLDKDCISKLFSGHLDKVMIDFNQDLKRTYNLMRLDYVSMVLADHKGMAALEMAGVSYKSYDVFTVNNELSGYKFVQFESIDSYVDIEASNILPEGDSYITKGMSFYMPTISVVKIKEEFTREGIFTFYGLGQHYISEDTLKKLKRSKANGYRVDES